MGEDFRAIMARGFVKSDTLAHTWVKGFWSHNIAGTPSVFPQCSMAIGFLPTLIDPVDLPDIAVHAGDWQLHDSRSLREPVVANEVMHPSELGSVDIESSGQRSAPGQSAYELFVVGQVGAIGGGQTTFRGAFTALWLVAN